MRSTRFVLAVVLAILVAVPQLQASSRGPEGSAPQSTASAPQSHAVEQQALDAAVQEHLSAADQDRETLRLFLERGEVRAIAGKYGVDVRRAESAVATMSAEELASVAVQARQADEGLAGGASTVTISTTTIIIALLVLILLIVALR